MGVEVKKLHPLQWLKSLFDKTGKAKYAIVLFALGILLLLFPGKPQTVPVSAPAEDEITAEPGVEERISAILSRMADAGRVEVMLTVKNEGEIIYQTDLEERRTDNSADTRVETVFGGASGRDGALVRQRNAPEYLGALVLAQGGDLPEVQYRIKLAVSSLTGLGTDKITVLKMK